MKKILAVLCTALLLAGGLTTAGCNEEKKPTRKKQTQKIKTKKVRVGDIDISYRIIGKGYPLVLIMGFTGTMDLWDSKVLDKLSSRYKVIIFDNRGMGRTAAPSGEFSIKQLADDTAGLMDVLGVKQAHILGWSMGTNIAQELVLNHPDKVNKLILYAADCGGSEAIEADSEIFQRLLKASDINKERFELMFPEKWLQKHPDFYENFPRPKEPADLQNIYGQYQAMSKFSSYERLPQINKPTLLITGTEDILTPPANSLIFVNRIPNAWLAQLQGGGHGVIYQYPDKFSQIVIDFLE